jgi:hypothetical protein
MPLALGDAWDVSNPEKPRADFDPNAVRWVRLDISDFLDVAAVPYTDHTMRPEAPMVVEESNFSDGVISALISVDPVRPTTFKVGKVYGVTFHFQAGQEIDEQTLYFRMKEK